MEKQCPVEEQWFLRGTKGLNEEEWGGIKQKKSLFYGKAYPAPQKKSLKPSYFLYWRDPMLYKSQCWQKGQRTWWIIFVVRDRSGDTQSKHSGDFQQVKNRAPAHLVHGLSTLPLLKLSLSFCAPSSYFSFFWMQILIPYQIVAESLEITMEQSRSFPAFPLCVWNITKEKVTSRRSFFLMGKRGFRNRELWNRGVQTSAWWNWARPGFAAFPAVLFFTPDTNFHLICRTLWW